MLFSWFRSDRNRKPAEALYFGIVSQARQPDFYGALGVPDSLDGRFELIVLHTYLVMRRLRKIEDKGVAMSQSLFDVMFDDLDRSLREIGVGDMTVGKRIKEMARAFYGRCGAYDLAMVVGSPAHAEAENAGADGVETPRLGLEEALRRNLFGTATPDAGALESIVRYVERAAAALDDQEDAAILSGALTWTGVELPPSRSQGDDGPAPEAAAS